MFSVFMGRISYQIDKESFVRRFSCNGLNQKKTNGKPKQGIGCRFFQDGVRVNSEVQREYLLWHSRSFYKMSPFPGY